ncbi:MAG: hypothetical protein RMK52_06800 [Chitinophagales bacterium]|nr:hypothetical protein [Chitinophagales bacterium]MDW8393937.1 hypothetical protein [Chitinophagales bacterium]
MKKLIAVFALLFACSTAFAQSVSESEKTPAAKSGCHSIKADSDKKCSSSSSAALCPGAKASAVSDNTMQASHEHAGAVKDKKKKCSKKHCGAGCKCAENKGEAGAQGCGGEKKAEGKGCCAAKKAEVPAPAQEAPDKQ